MIRPSDVHFYPIHPENETKLIPPSKAQAFSDLCQVLEHFDQDDRARLLAAAALLYVWEPEAESYLARSFRSKGSP